MLTATARTGGSQDNVRAGAMIIGMDRTPQGRIWACWTGPATTTSRTSSWRRATNGTATFFSLGGDRVAIIHNPGSKLALWISDDGMQTWPYQRLLPQSSCVGPKEGMSLAHGFVSRDRRWIHFGFVDHRHRAMHYSARLPALE